MEDRRNKKQLSDHKKVSFFDWILNDETTVMGILLKISFYGRLLFLVVLLYLMFIIEDRFMEALLFIFILMTVWRLYKVYTLGGFKNIKVSMNDLVYGGKFNAKRKS
jgi:hypothetical protein